MKLGIKMITFDAFDTLFKVRGNIGQIYATAVNKYSLATGRVLNEKKTSQLEEEFRVAYNYYYQKWPNFGYRDRISSEQWWHCVIKLALYNVGYVHKESVIHSITNHLYTDFCLASHWQVFFEVPETLGRLKASGIRLGVISNFDERLEMVLDNLHLSHFFDFISCSKLVGIPKPDIKFFQVTAEANGLQCSDCLHIGDNIELDYNAARNAGMHAALIDRSLQSLQLTEPVSLHKLSDVFALLSNE